MSFMLLLDALYIPIRFFLASIYARKYGYKTIIRTRLYVPVYTHYTNALIVIMLYQRYRGMAHA